MTALTSSRRVLPCAAPLNEHSQRDAEHQAGGRDLSRRRNPHHPASRSPQSSAHPASIARTRNAAIAAAAITLAVALAGCGSTNPDIYTKGAHLTFSGGKTYTFWTLKTNHRPEKLYVHVDTQEKNRLLGTWVTIGTKIIDRSNIPAVGHSKNYQYESQCASHTYERVRIHGSGVDHTGKFYKVLWFGPNGRLGIRTGTCGLLQATARAG